VREKKEKTKNNIEKREKMREHTSVHEMKSRRKGMQAKRSIRKMKPPYTTGMKKVHSSRPGLLQKNPGQTALDTLRASWPTWKHTLKNDSAPKDRIARYESMNFGPCC
jgi:hypothetical protein